MKPISNFERGYEIGMAVIADTSHDQGAFLGRYEQCPARHLINDSGLERVERPVSTCGQAFLEANSKVIYEGHCTGIWVVESADELLYIFEFPAPVDIPVSIGRQPRPISTQIFRLRNRFKFLPGLDVFDKLVEQRVGLF